jgi:hypothetical protein
VSNAVNQSRTVPTVGVIWYEQSILLVYAAEARETEPVAAVSVPETEGQGQETPVLNAGFWFLKVLPQAL